MRAPGSFASLLYPLKKRWYILVICVGLSAIAATRYLYMATPLYQASASIKIEDDQQGPAASSLYKDFDVSSGSSASAEAEILRSRKLFSAALEKLDFYVEYFRSDELNTKEFYKNTPFTVDFKVMDSTFYNRDYKIQYKGGNAFALTYDFFGHTVQRNGSFGTIMNDRGIMLTVRKNDQLLHYVPNELKNNWSFKVYSPAGLTAHLLNEDYVVKPIDKESNVVKIYYTHPIQEKAVKLVNAIAQTYIQSTVADKQNIAGNTADFLNGQLAQVSLDLEHARDAIKNYRVQNNIVNIAQSTESTYKTLGELEVQKVQLSMQQNALEAMSDYLRRNKEITLSGPDLGSVNDPLFTDAVTRLNTKIRERGELLHKYTADNDKVKVVDADIAQQKAFLVESINNTRRKLYDRQDELDGVIAEQKASFKGVPEQESTLQDLTRNYYLNEKIYNFLIEKRTEAMISSRVETSMSRVIESAALPLEAISPRPNVVWGVFLMVGFILGLILTYARHYSRPNVSAPEDFAPHGTIPVIGQVQKLTREQPAYKAFTALTTRILMQQEHGEPQVITVTSTRKGEGKSFVATNLARTLAAMDKKVVLIDLNTHNPCLSHWFDARGTEGIQEVYAQQFQLHDVIQLTSIPNLDLITTGTGTSPIGHLIATGKTKQIIDELRQDYDAVIIDTPEVGEFTDAIPFMKWSDLNLYVVKADSDRDALQANAEMVKEEYRLQEVHFVLNAMTEKRNHTGYVVPEKPVIKFVKTKKLPQLTNIFMW